MARIENPPEPGIRPARIQEASELSHLCVRSKAVWGYDETFMFLARPALAVSPEQIAAGDVWIAADAQGSVAGLVALGPGDQPHALDLDKLFVEPRRIRAGVGCRLLSHRRCQRQSCYPRHQRPVRGGAPFRSGCRPRRS